MPDQIHGAGSAPADKASIDMDIVVINFNTREHLRACLASIRTQPVGRVLVVDNASTDGSAGMVRREFPWVELRANAANPGYGTAANQALAECQASYSLLLNSDTRLKPGAIVALTAYLEAHPRAGVVGPRLLNPDGSPQPSCYSFPTPLHVLLEESTLIRLIRRLPGVREWLPRTAQRRGNGAVAWVLGAALALRVEAFRQVGGFDETFFLYAEEIDLSYRLRQAGWETHFAADASVIHTGGASSSQQRGDMLVQFYASLVHFYRRHYTRWQLTQLIWIMKSIVLARWLRDAARRRLDRERPSAPWLAEDVSAWRRILFGPAAREQAGEESLASR